MRLDLLTAAATMIYTRAGNPFRLMNPEQCGSIARHMQTGNTPQEIQLRKIRSFFRADLAYGISVAQALRD